MYIQVYKIRNIKLFGMRVSLYRLLALVCSQRQIQISKHVPLLGKKKVNSYLTESIMALNSEQLKPILPNKYRYHKRYPFSIQRMHKIIISRKQKIIERETRRKNGNNTLKFRLEKQIHSFNLLLLKTYLQHYNKDLLKCHNLRVIMQYIQKKPI